MSARQGGTSVALCTYQGARWVGAFLDGLLAQSTPPDELVVSDDGSTDATLDTVADFAATAPFPVRVHRTPERLGSTFNFAVAAARCTGGLIALADQDDIWMPTKLERLAAAMDERDLAMAFSDGTVIDDEGRRIEGITLWEGVGFDRRARARFARDPLGLLLRRSVVTGAAMMFRAEHLERVLPFPAALNGPGSLMLQDRWIALVLACVARVGAVDEPLIAFRRHAGQQTGLREPVTSAEVAHQLRRTTASSAEGLRTRAQQLEAVRDRVGDDAHPGDAARLEAAIGHLRTRAGLADRRLARIVSVAGEWCSGRYRRYSSGSRSAAADLLRPPGSDSSSGEGSAHGSGTIGPT